MSHKDDPITQMMVTPDDVREFQRIIKEEHGVELSKDEAIVMIRRLMSLCEIIARPLPSEANRRGVDNVIQPHREAGKA